MANQIDFIEFDEDILKKPITQKYEVLKAHFDVIQIVGAIQAFMVKVDETFTVKNLSKPEHPLALIADEIDTDEPFNTILKCSDLLFVYCKYYKYFKYLRFLEDCLDCGVKENKEWLIIMAIRSLRKVLFISKLPGTITHKQLREVLQAKGDSDMLAQLEIFQNFEISEKQRFEARQNHWEMLGSKCAIHSKNNDLYQLIDTFTLFFPFRVNSLGDLRVMFTKFEFYLERLASETLQGFLSDSYVLSTDGEYEYCPLNRNQHYFLVTLSCRELSKREK